MARVGSGWAWTLVVAGVMAAAACGSTEHGQPASSGGADAAAGTSGTVLAGANVGGGPSTSGGAEPTAHAGAQPNAGQASAGTAAGGSSPSAGAGGFTEGGASLSGAGAGGESEGGAAGAPSCDSGCTTESFSNFCQQGEITWVCSNNYDSALMRASCRDAATNAIRYCCSPAFMTRCQ